MNEIIEKDTGVLAHKPDTEVLSISCHDTIGVKARMTFDSEDVQGMHITYWMDDDDDIEKRIDSIFAMMFEEVLKTRELDSRKLINQ